MKKKDLAKLSEADLTQKRKELTLELIKLHAQVATGTQLKSPGQIRQIRQTIARIETELMNKARNAKG